MSRVPTLASHSHVRFGWRCLQRHRTHRAGKAALCSDKLFKLECTLVPRQWVRMLNAWRWKSRDRPTTVKEFLFAVAPSIANPTATPAGLRSGVPGKI